MTPTISPELDALYREAGELEDEGRFDRAAYERLLARAEALGVPRANAWFLHKMAARARLISLSDVMPKGGNVVQFDPATGRITRA